MSRQHYTGFAIIASGQKQDKLINWLFMDFVEKGLVTDVDYYAHHDNDQITGKWLRKDGVVIFDNKHSEFDIKEGLIPLNIDELKRQYQEKHIVVFEELQKFYNTVTIELVSYEYYT